MPRKSGHPLFLLRAYNVQTELAIDDRFIMQREDDSIVSEQEQTTDLDKKIKTGVLLIAHGSRRAEANQELVDLSIRLLMKMPYEIIEPSFLELAEPDIVTGGSTCVGRGANRVLMVPYFLSAGVHIRRDLTEAQEELRKKFPHVDFRLGPPLGPDDLLDTLVQKRVQELAISH